MNISHVALIAVLTFGTSTAWAQSNTNINTNPNNTTTISGMRFSQTSNDMAISQNITGDNSFCQFFVFSFGMSKIIQIIQGNSFTQVFSSASDPVEDPCL